MRIAFKEWAVVVDALGRGEQILILRKGGISEAKGGFRVNHAEFLLFPTLFHQHRESIVSAAEKRFDVVAAAWPGTSQVRLEFFGQVVTWNRLSSKEDMHRLRGQHIWREEVITERFDGGKDKSIYAIAIRVFRLPQAVELPMLDSYGGCKSWIEVAEDVSTNNAVPILDDESFAASLRRLKGSLESSSVTKG